MSRTRVGTMSWSAPSWNGTFFPKGVKAEQRLALYAREFDTVETDSTFYRVPLASAVAGWRSQTPGDFALAAKFPRALVARSIGEIDAAALAQRAADTRTFVERMQGLGPK